MDEEEGLADLLKQRLNRPSYTRYVSTELTRGTLDGEGSERPQDYTEAASVTMPKKTNRKKKANKSLKIQQIKGKQLLLKVDSELIPCLEN